jgi:hypothetical protein
MSSLTAIEKSYLEKLFMMSGGYVLNFSDRTMGEFFATELGIDIYDQKFNYASGSKANRMRGFWVEADDILVGTSILKLIAYIEAQVLLDSINAEEIKPDLLQACKRIGVRLGGRATTSQQPVDQASVEAFLEEDFKDVAASIKTLEADIQDVINQRLNEISAILKSAPLAAVFLIGSTLEGILIDVGIKNSAAFVGATSAPRFRGLVPDIKTWKLNDLINVAHELGFVTKNVKEFSHALRSFRNYIHPRAQATAGFNPNADTAIICFQVLKAAITELAGHVAP